jgi:hypothetical protein
MRSLPSVLPKGSVFFFWWEAYSPSGHGKPSFRSAEGKRFLLLVGSVSSYQEMGSIESAILPLRFANGKHRKCDPSVLPMGSIESAILPFYQWEASKVRSFRFTNGKHRKYDPSVLPMRSIERAILPFRLWEAPSPSIKWDEWKSDDNGFRFG